MKVAVLTGAALALCVGVAAYAVHFELSARTQTYHEINLLRGQTRTALDTHRITPSRATAVDESLRDARLELEQDDVRAAQKVINGVKADLAATHTRAA